MAGHRKTNSINEQLSYFNYKPPPSVAPSSSFDSGSGYTSDSGSRPASIHSNVTSPALSVHSPQGEAYMAPISLDNDGQQQSEEVDQSKIILPASDPRSPYHISLPYQTTQPTEELSKRFAIWKKIIKQLIFYFKELAMLRQHYYQLNVHMLQNIQFLSLNNKNNPKRNINISPVQSSTNLDQSFHSQHGQQHSQSSPQLPTSTSAANSTMANDIFFGTSEDKFINSSFLPTTSKSVQGLSSTLFNYHKALSEKELQTYNELSLKIIPRLENLKKSLNFKIKEIMNLKGDFKFHTLRSEVAKTGQLLNVYVNSVEYLEKGFATNMADEKFKVTGKQDPYLLKLQLDLQLKRQLLEENYLKEAFNNLQVSGLELEKIIYKELQTAMSKFSNLINQELSAVKTSLVDDLNENFLQNDPVIDWNYYMNNDNGRNFLNTESKRKFRKLSDIAYPYRRKVMSSSLRSGFLQKKNKVTKTYSKFYYVLSSNYMHEFKTSDRQKEQTPIQSLNLNKCTLVEHSDLKIIVQYITKEKAKVNFVLKCSDHKEASKWACDLRELTSFKSAVERNKFLEMKFANYASQVASSINSSSISSSSSASSMVKTPQQQQQQQQQLQSGTPSANPSLNIKFVPRHSKSPSSSSLKQATGGVLSKSSSSSSLHKVNSSSSLSKVLNASSFEEDPGKFTAHLNLSSHNLVPSINVTDHSPSTRHSSGSSIVISPSTTPNNYAGTSTPPASSMRNVDYFNVKPVSPVSPQQAQGQQPGAGPSGAGLTMNIDRKLPFSAGSRASPPLAAQQQQAVQQRAAAKQFRLNLPSSNLNQLMVNDIQNSIKTPGELPSSSIGDIIHGYTNQQDK